MNKQKKPLKKIGKYLSKISVIVIGVAITLGVSHWISVRSEKRDIALHLNAIKLELEENIKHIEGIKRRLEPNVRYTNYLRSHDKKSLNRDSIEKYMGAAYAFEIYVPFKTTAFEMFKQSGTMRLLDDKEVLLSLWNVYQQLDFLQNALDWLFQIRVEELKKEFPLVFSGQNVDVPMYFFHITGTANLMMGPIEMVLKMSREVTEKIEGNDNS